MMPAVIRRSAIRSQIHHFDPELFEGSFGPGFIKSLRLIRANVGFKFFVSTPLASTKILEKSRVCD